MSKRILGSMLFAAVLTLLLAATAAFFSTSTQAQDASGSANSGKLVPSGIWTPIATYPTATIDFTPQPSALKLKRAGAVTYPSNGKIYVLGGRHGIDGEDTTLRWIWEFTPGDPGSWIRKNALLDSSAVGSRWTANMAVAVLTDTNGPRIYAIGGNSIDSVPTPVVRVYDPNADAVTTLASDPWPATTQYVPGGWAVYNNKLYVFGGFTSIGPGAVFAETWRFDPMAADGTKWSQITGANLSSARGYIAGALLDGYIYAIGGHGWNTTTRQLVPMDTVERMDPSQASPTWVTVAGLPTARGEMGAWAYNTGTNYEISGKIAVAGGWAGNANRAPDNLGYLYNPVTNSWGAFPNLLNATRNYGVAQHNGYLYAMGGYDYSAGLPSGANFNQRYDATTPAGTATPTSTGTRPTSTNTPTITLTPLVTNTPLRTNTPSITPTACGSYSYTTATATIVPGTTDIGSSCDDCVTTITLPFPFTLYGQGYTSANVSSNGNIQFATTDTAFTNQCPLPDADLGPAILPHWDDLRTDAGAGCPATGCGIFTSVSGSAPNRIFNIEWRTRYFAGSGGANFELRLYEGAVPSRFDFIYGTVESGGDSASIGVQNGTNLFTTYSCDTAGNVPTGRLVAFQSQPCGTPATATPTPPGGTLTPTRTFTISPTPMRTNTPATPSNTPMGPSHTPIRTNTSVPPTNTVTHTPLVTNTPCVMNFSDVMQGDYFYDAVRYMFCNGIISGYGDGTFRPYNNTTRGQLCKIVVLAMGWPLLDPPNPTFNDVPRASTFYQFVETAYAEGIISGYECGTGCLEFRPNNNVTRGQLSKIVVLGMEWPLLDPKVARFTDVARGSTFYTFVETAAFHGIISGYGDNTFRPGNNATRGQISVIVYRAIKGPSPTATPMVTSTPMATATPVQVNISSFAFVPQTITITVGTTVRWTNLDAVQHSSTSTANPQVWDSGLLSQNQSYTFTFTTAGSYAYRCTPHAAMTGTVIVTGGAKP